MRFPILTLGLALPLLAQAPLSSSTSNQEPKLRRPATQDPKPDEATPEPARDIFGRALPKEGKARPTNGLKGCWQVLDVQLQGFPGQGRGGTGFVLIDDHFFAMEVHMSWPSGVHGADLHQSFIGEYKLIDATTIQVTTLIGSGTDRVSTAFEWERSGIKREYTFTLSDKSLVLTFGQGNRIALAPRRPTANPTRDIFGRGTVEASTERDIFGRPVNPKSSDQGGGQAASPPPAPDTKSPPAGGGR